MPEKAMKMQGWIIVGRYIERNFEEKTYTKWLIAGSVAGAATTVVGKRDAHACTLRNIPYL